MLFPLSVKTQGCDIQNAGLRRAEVPPGLDPCSDVDQMPGKEDKKRCACPEPAALIYTEQAERTLSPACGKQTCHPPGPQRRGAGEKPAKPGSDCSRLLLRRLQRGKERRGAGASSFRLPTCTLPAGRGTALGASIFAARIPWGVQGPWALLPTAACLQPGMESLSHGLKKKATEQHYRAEVMIAGEQLRLRLHDGKLIKDRRYHLRTYPNCFVAKELTDWLIDHKEAPDRETGIRLMQKLMDHYIIHHVCDEHSDYKDAKLLYRFRKDDGTFPLSKDVKVFMRGQSLYEKLVSVEESILKVREENSVKYQRTFLGCEMIDWLVQEGEAENRKEAVELGRALLEHGIIQHVSNRHHFFDSDILYQFWINFRRRRRLTELLNENSSRALSESPDSPFCLRKLNPDPGNTSFLSVQTNKEIKIVSAVRRSSITSLAGNSNPYFSTAPAWAFPPVAECNPKSVLKRPVTNEELLSPGAPYIKKTLTIVGDAVGWGFVVRGGRPCHIQAVDPGGPAAAAGMKVCQFVFSVNGMYVLHLDYQTISSLIMTGPRTLMMEVMEALE
ncbi:DEP domain-containing mTOR-interacting protein-like [Calonectris borealis]|uniref:DEP domain-containing mTOR-interacting protein-like n=1 Tax=Calonectris borealis TaxID=1323832 RepID=UPI003F4B1C4E